jgi:hypothetical protein
MIICAFENSPLNSKLLGDKDCLHWIWPVKKMTVLCFVLFYVCLYCVLFCVMFVSTVFCFVLCLSLLCFVLFYVCLYCVLFCFTFVCTVFCFVLCLSLLCFVLFYVCLCCVLEKHLKVMFKWKVDVHNFPLIINWPTMYICVVKTIREEGKNFPYRLFFFLEQLIVLLLSSGIYAEMWVNGIIFARQKAF